MPEPRSLDWLTWLPEPRSLESTWMPEPSSQDGLGFI